MAKITLEWPGERPKTWRRANVDVQFSRRGNSFVKHRGDGEDEDKVYVFKDRRVGTPVLSKNGNEWVEVGRIEFGGNVFLGGEEQMSYAEYSRTPEALEASKKLMEDLQSKRWKKD